MAVITPNSDVILLKVPLEIDEANQLTFASATAQYNYFNGLTGKLPFDKFTYQRKDGTIRIPALMDDILSYNYVMYRNTAHGSKWFYAFIESMEYVNDSVTAVKIKTDTWQTYQFDLTFKPTFVLREHTNDDTIGSNIVPENVDTGEPTINDSIVHMSPNITGNFVTFMVSDTGPINKVWTDMPSQYNGIFSGYAFFGVDSLSDAQRIVDRYVDNTREEAIQNIFMAPKSVYGNYTTSIIDTVSPTITIYYPEVMSSPQSIIASQTISRINTLDGYTPKNNKLYTYPYSYLYVTNNTGSDVEFRYEDFTNATPTFSLGGILCSGCDIKLNPLNYKNVSTANQAYGLKAGKFPVCSWNTDAHAIWLAQNQLNMTVAGQELFVGATTGAALAKVTGDYSKLGTAGTDFLAKVFDSLKGDYLSKHMPDQAHGDVNSSNYNYSIGNWFDFRRMSVRAETARIIDDYFSAFGYATNRVKTPNITGRRNWNYVKTARCYIEADIPQEDLQEIKNMFDTGVTFWHNPATFADYSQANDILT